MTPTHQSLSGASDEELLQRMVATHPERFGPAYWAFFDASVGPSLPPRPVILDLGWRRDFLGEPECSPRGFRLFAAHNKYTPEDWQWLLAQAGFAILERAQLRASHQIFVASPR